MGLMGRPAPSPVTTCNCLYHITDTTFTIQPSMFQSLPKRKPKISRAFCVVSRGRVLACHRIFAGKACLGAFICAWPSRKLKISRAFRVVSPGRILACHLNFCWESFLGGFLMRMAKSGNYKFRERSVLFHADVLWLDTSVFAGKACLGALICAWH